MTTFYLVRHAEPDWAFKNARNLTGALRDYVTLTENGLQQAEQIVKKHPYIRESELVLSSPFTRSLHTAAIINRQLALPILVEYDLHEWLPDNFEVNTHAEIQALTKEFFAHEGRHPDGESKLWETKQSVVDRTRAAMAKYLDHSRVIVVCHGMVITSLLNYGYEEVELGSVHPYVME